MAKLTHNTLYDTEAFRWECWNAFQVCGKLELEKYQSLKLGRGEPLQPLAQFANHVQRHCRAYQRRIGGLKWKIEQRCYF